MYAINEVRTTNPDRVRFRQNGKDWYVCNVCGRVVRYRRKAYGKYWCTKHYGQLERYGHATDANPRTPCDRNRIVVDGNVAKVELYDKKLHVIAVALIDAEDVEKVRYIRWRLSASGYVMNAPKFKAGSVRMSRVIMMTDQLVDHVNHDMLDDRKANLRILTRSQNAMGSKHVGVTMRPDGRFHAHIKRDGRMLDLGVYVDVEEALYARWYAEALLFGERRYPKEEPCIPSDRVPGIRAYVERKVQRL